MVLMRLAGPQELQGIEALTTQAHSRQWRPNRWDRKVLTALSRIPGPVIPRDDICTVLGEAGARCVAGMNDKLIALLLDSAHAQEFPSDAASSATQSSLRAVTALVRDLAGQRKWSRSLGRGRSERGVDA